MSDILLKIGEIGTSNKADAKIKTLGLGSCIAIILLDPETRTGGMAHIALPDSGIAPPGVVEKLPGRFADTGVPALLDAMEKQGASNNPSKLIAKLAGGASIMEGDNVFNVGKRNTDAVKKILTERGITVASEDLGGHMSRSVMVDLEVGGAMVYSPGRGQWKL